MSIHRKSVIISLLFFVMATVDSVGSLLGFWSESGVEKPIRLVVKGLILLGLIGLSFSIKNWVYQNTSKSMCRKIAWLSFVSLILCVGGDIVNANLPNTFYRYQSVVKHDYLVESIFFFGPGYLLLLVNGILVARDANVKDSVTAITLLAGLLLGALSVLAMHLPGTGLFVTAMTVGYAGLIGAVGFLGFVIIHSFGGIRNSHKAWLVGLGFILACVADAVIGTFWIYGNGGEGDYPAVRDVNWILYIGSQGLVIFLPSVLVSHHQRIKCQ